MADYDPNEFVRMTHPQVKAVSGQVTRRAYEEVHKAKGWRLASAEQAAAADAGEAAVESPKPAK